MGATRVSVHTPQGELGKRTRRRTWSKLESSSHVRLQEHGSNGEADSAKGHGRNGKTGALGGGSWGSHTGGSLCSCQSSERRAEHMPCGILTACVPAAAAVLAPEATATVAAPAAAGVVAAAALATEFESPAETPVELPVELQAEVKPSRAEEMADDEAPPEAQETHDLTAASFCLV